uniref:WIZ zinc finger b n=1 Tax=Hucho hucho TaxID=62062 RepID=A0A4W5P5J0_9TELE
MCTPFLGTQTQRAPHQHPGHTAPSSSVGRRRGPCSGPSLARAPGNAHQQELGRRQGVLPQEQRTWEDLEKVEEEKGGEEEGGGEGELGEEIFTCVECSIYFKKQVYLQDHMQEHSQSRPGAGRRERGVKGARFRCVECGWNLSNRLALVDHHRRHQESRQKILEEIGKLTKVKGPANRRYLCLKCDFSTRTSQALANHAKTHNRKPTGLQRASPRFQPKLTPMEPPVSPGSASGLTSISLTCDQCAFQASSQTALKEHQHVAHPAQTSICREGPEEINGPGSRIDASSPPCSDKLSKPVSPPEGQTVPAWPITEPGLPVASPPCPVEVPAPAMQLKRIFLASLPTALTPKLSSLTLANIRRFLAEGISDEDYEEIDEETGTLKSVERKCPYCPDRFHNGIGLANHVRGHLNRVGVSYNVRHFISPEEVNAIEKKFSYQKKKKKVANFDPDTFSVMRCEFCNAGFDTRAGLSSHARAHLRDFGITNWEVTISPIHILRELFSSRPDLEEEPGGGEGSEEATGATVSNLLPSSPSQPWKKDHSVGEPEGVLSNLLKCEVCSAPFETRRGLSSHARSHLRQLGIGMSESSGAPIDLLYQITKERGLDGHFPRPPVAKKPLLVLPTPQKEERYQDTDMDEKPISLSIPSPVASPPPSSLIRACSPSPVLPLPQLPQCLARPPNVPSPPNYRSSIGCEFCGEYFENRKGLSSHARSHLRQMGITEWTVNGSPIDTLRELITRRGLPCALPLKPLKSPPPSPGPPRSPLSSPASPSLLSRLPFAFAHPPSHQSTVRKMGSAPPASPSLIVKLKPEPMQLEVTMPGAVGGAAGYSSEPLNCSWSSSDNMLPLNLVEPTRDIRCEFCGEYFENRKGLSSHARSHLRQMGITEWTVNGSPIDTLRELMHNNGGISSPAPGLKKETSHGSSPTWEGLVGGLGYQSPKFSHASCELCGFYFENRKALASHARAHLRQFGVTEWCVNGSPIETLSAWMRSRPHKVVEMHRSYMQGSNRSTSKKVREELIYLVVYLMVIDDSKITMLLTILAVRFISETGRPGPGVLSSSCPGFERRPLKHPSHSEGGERDSGTPKPPRTGTIPALVPKPPSTPLVKVVGKIYSLRCRFCEVEFQGPLSVQEDWIRHLQQHILNLNYNKPAPSATDPPAQDHHPTPTSTSVQATTSSFTTTHSPTSTPPSIHTHTTAPTVLPPCSPSPPPMAESAPIVTAIPMATASAESTLTPILIPIPTPAL